MDPTGSKPRGDACNPDGTLMTLVVDFYSELWSVVQYMWLQYLDYGF